MANPFTSPTLSGFNASPPPNDGTQVTANQLDWDVHHIGKIGTPLKNYIDDLVTNTNAAFATVDDASNLTTGELADDRLSSNVPLKNGNNVFTKSGAGLTSAPIAISAANAWIVFNDTSQVVDEKRWIWGVDGKSFRLITRSDADGSLETPLRINRGTGGAITLIDLAGDSVQANGSNILRAADVGTSAIDHDNLSGFVSNEHINHANIGITAGNGLTGGGDLTLARSLALGTPSTLSKTTSNGVTATSHTHDIASTVWDTATRSTGATLVAGQVHARTANTTVESGFAAGQWTAVYNNGTGSITLTQGSGLTLRLAGTTNTGNRTLAGRGLAVIWYNSSSEAIVSGNGVS